MKAEDALSRVRRVEVKAKKIVDTLLQSSYRSIFRGRGLEFSEVREYRYGDDIRYIDWNVTARTGKIHVKEFIEERDLLLYLLLDTSASTSFGTIDLKRKKAVLLTATLAYSAFRGNDRVALVLFSSRVEKSLRPGKGRGQVYRVVREAVNSGEGKGTSLVPAIDFTSRVLRERGIIFLISDLISRDLEEAVKRLRELKVRGNDIIVIKLEDPRDYSIPDVGYMELEDPETGEHLIIDTSDERLREEYSKLALQRETYISELFRKSGIDLIRVSTEEDIFKPLIKFFQLREKRRARV